MNDATGKIFKSALDSYLIQIDVNPLIVIAQGSTTIQVNYNGNNLLKTYANVSYTSKMFFFCFDKEGFLRFKEFFSVD